MKLKCISKVAGEGLQFIWLTVGKEYVVYELKYDKNNYLVKDDQKNDTTYPKHCFISLQDLREKKINEILNDTIQN